MYNMKTSAKLDNIMAPIINLKNPTIGEFIEATNKACAALEKIMSEEYKRGVEDGKNAKTAELIKKN